MANALYLIGGAWVAQVAIIIAVFNAPDVWRWLRRKAGC